MISEKWQDDEDSSDSNTSVGLSGLECGSLAALSLVGASVSAVLSTTSVGSVCCGGSVGCGGSVLHKAAFSELIIEPNHLQHYNHTIHH